MQVPSKENGKCIQDLNSLMAFREGFLKANEEGSHGAWDQLVLNSQLSRHQDEVLRIISLLVSIDLGSTCS